MKSRRQRRSGNILVLAAFMMIIMMAGLALAVDLGYIQVIRTQMQGATDAAALAATLELIDAESLTGFSEPTAVVSRVRLAAGQFSGLNKVGGESPAVSFEDVVIGYIQDPSDPNVQMDFSDPSRFNAVQIRLRRTAEQNGEVPLYFARALGFDSYAGQTQATAVFLDNIAGFRIPAPGQALGILPFAFDQALWNAMMAGAGNDDFSPVWNDDTGAWDTAPVADGIREINLFPQEVGAPGNFGTINIGANNNSTNTLRRQIEVGLTAEDMSHYPNGELMIDDITGTLDLTGDTGISAGMESALQAIIGQPRIVPLYRQVSGVGTNATYEIVKFVGVRVLEVDLRGGLETDKRLVLQPANVTIPGAIRATVVDPINPSPEEQRSQFVYSPVWLIQ